VQGIVEAKSAVTNDRPARSGPSVDRKASESVCFRKVATGTLETPATPTPGAPPNAAPGANSSDAALGPDPALANLARYYCEFEKFEGLGEGLGGVCTHGVFGCYLGLPVQLRL
jgi:hypothetical protein